MRVSLLSSLKVIVFSVVMLTLSGCTTAMERLQNVGKPPAIHEMATPMDSPEYKPVQWDEDKLLEYEDDDNETRTYANSLWQQGSRAFFQDRKARRIGDILTVVVRVQDRAELGNETLRQRNEVQDVDVTAAAGLAKLATGWLPGKAIPATLIDTVSNLNNRSIGSTEREEIIQTQVAAMVTQILPNGNLVIRGDQEIRVNFELRRISVEGIVRPEDINAANSVDSNQIAQARINYGGSGQITEIQQSRIGSQILDIISPF
jgi:flagellar L-ring protein precursor FlgH